MTTPLAVAAQKHMGDAINSGHLEDFDQLVAPTCVDHDPAPGQQPGPAGFRSMFGQLRDAFPDLHAEVDHMTSGGDDVAIAYTLTGTHRGDFQGRAPTGRSFAVRGVQIARFKGGKMTERWGSSDQLGIFQQLGLEPRS